MELVNGNVKYYSSNQTSEWVSRRLIILACYIKLNANYIETKREVISCYYEGRPSYTALSWLISQKAPYRDMTLQRASLIVSSSNRNFYYRSFSSSNFRILWRMNSIYEPLFARARVKSGQMFAFFWGSSLPNVSPQHRRRAP